jgi:hypothetical protein
MKKLLLIGLALCMVLMTVAVISAAQAASSTVNGYVSDSMCGAKGAAAGHEACTKKCLDKGAKMVVVTDADKTILTVENPDALAGHEGHHVAITGHVNGDSIHIDGVKML